MVVPLYVIVVFVIVGVPPAILHDSLPCMADATEQLLGIPSMIGVSIVAVLALTSMANAGVLSSSPFPLAVNCDVLLVRPQRPRENNPLQRLVERYVF